MVDILERLQTDYPDLAFQPGGQFYWSARHKHIVHPTLSELPGQAWSLLHEVGHALLAHRGYSSDYELLEMEVAAWEKAKAVAAQYAWEIDEDHIQDCLDTYRDWIHSRSRCPQCMAVGLQEERTAYRCVNCRARWQVSPSRFARLHRRLQHTEKPGR